MQPTPATKEQASLNVRVDGGDDSLTTTKDGIPLPAHGRHGEAAQSVQDAASFAPAFTSAPGRDTQKPGAEALHVPAQALESTDAPVTHGPRQLEVSVHDPVLGQIDVRAEMRSGSVHAWLRTTSLTEATNPLVPELHSFLRSHDVTLQSLQVTRAEPAQTRSTGGMIAEAGGSAGQPGGGNDGAASGRQREGTRSFAASESSCSSDKGATPKAVFVPAAQRSGNSISIHI